MNSELRELYQQVILDHNKSPRNFRVMENPTQEADGHNPLCGDSLHIYLQVEDDIIKDVSFKSSGCAISKSSASIMTSMIKGKSVKEADTLFENFHGLVTGKLGEDADLSELGKLSVFAGVKDFPIRVKCASLAWHTMKSALYQNGKKVTTE